MQINETADSKHGLQETQQMTCPTVRLVHQAAQPRVGNSQYQKNYQFHQKTSRKETRIQKGGTEAACISDSLTCS